MEDNQEQEEFGTFCHTNILTGIWNKILRILNECAVLTEKSVTRVTVWLNCDPRDRFVDRYLAHMLDSFSCTPRRADTYQFYLEIFLLSHQPF